MKHISPEQAQKLRWLIRDCGQQAKQMGTETFQVFEKGINDYVTNVDRTLDQRLSEGIATLFPHDGIVTEENSQSRARFHQRYPRYWFVDPLDGTDDFIHHRSHYAVMAGLVDQYQPVAGWIYAPMLERFYYGGSDWGLFQVRADGLPQALIPTEPLPPTDTFCPMMIGYKDRRQFGAAIAQAIPGVQFRSIGSFGLKVMEVVQGRAGIYIYLNKRVKLWDTSGPIALAQAAGLVCCDIAGNPLKFSPESVDPDSLAHLQTIVIAWPTYLDALRSRLHHIVMNQP